MNPGVYVVEISDAVDAACCYALPSSPAAEEVINSGPTDSEVHRPADVQELVRAIPALQSFRDIQINVVEKQL